MKILTDLFWIFQGFNVCYNGEVYTTTLWAQFICNIAVRDGKFRKINKNHYKLIFPRERINKYRKK